MCVPDHLTCLLRNLYMAQETTVRSGNGKMDWFKIGKGVQQGCIFSPCLFNLHAVYIIWSIRLNESQARIKIAGECRYTYQIWRWYHCNGRKWRGITESSDEDERGWMRMKKLTGNWKFKKQIMASVPITSWQVEGENVEALTDFIFLGSRITVDSDCSHESKALAPWKESYDKPRQHIQKQRHHFARKDPYSQSYGFSSSHVWMWELDHKEAWVLRNWCFRTVILKKTLESPLDYKEIKLICW